jgi:hypothetical protein
MEVCTKAMERNSADNAVLIEKCCICRLKIPREAQRYVMSDLRVCCTPCGDERKNRKVKRKV